MSEEKAAENKAEVKKEQKKKEVKDKVIKIKESEHNALLAQVEEFKDKYLRIHAEFDNARKRMDREKDEFVKYASEGLIAEFLNILDSLEHSLTHAKDGQADESFVKGLEMVIGNINELLKRNNVEPIEAVGKPFDPHGHEVLLQEESEEHDEGIVIEVLQKGYLLGGKVLRTAKVKVAKAANKEKSTNNLNS